MLNFHRLPIAALQMINCGVYLFQYSSYCCNRQSPHGGDKCIFFHKLRMQHDCSMDAAIAPFAPARPAKFAIRRRDWSRQATFPVPPGLPTPAAVVAQRGCTGEIPAAPDLIWRLPMPELDSQIRAALYARVSTWDQGQTAGTQLVSLREFAAPAGLAGRRRVRRRGQRRPRQPPGAEGHAPSGHEETVQPASVLVAGSAVAAGSAEDARAAGPACPLRRGLAQLHGAVSGLGRAVRRGDHRAAGVAGAAGAAADPGAGAGGARPGAARGQAARPSRGGSSTGCR